MSALGEPVRSPGFERLVERCFRDDAKPEVLDLGPMCGDTIVGLAERGARVRVEPFASLLPVDPEESGREPFRIDARDATYDVVVAWDRLEFVAKDRLAEFGAEVVRVLKPGGWFFGFASQGREPTATPMRYRLNESGKLVREPAGLPEAPRFTHPNREIERSLKGLAIQGIHLHRDQRREIVATRKERVSPRRAVESPAKKKEVRTPPGGSGRGGVRGAGVTARPSVRAPSGSRPAGTGGGLSRR